MYRRTFDSELCACSGQGVGRSRARLKRLRLNLRPRERSRQQYTTHFRGGRNFATRHGAGVNVSRSCIYIPTEARAPILDDTYRCCRRYRAEVPYRRDRSWEDALLRIVTRGIAHKIKRSKWKPFSVIAIPSVLLF